MTMIAKRFKTYVWSLRCPMEQLKLFFFFQWNNHILKNKKQKKKLFLPQNMTVPDTT
jgi:hypothetical protein